MVKHLEIHDILVNCQHGFRAKSSCETQLISLTQEITNHLYYGIQNDLLILDFSKAFDKVSHKKLLFKLDNYGIRDTTLKWIGSFLNNRMPQAVLDGESSSKFPVVSGVPHGLSWDPLLFLTFINDLPAAVSQIRLFPDDYILYRPIRHFSN